MDNHNTVIIRKPWGYEYIAYQNQEVALKVLHISPGERTSMHCHPDKSTGLVVVKGQARINFIADQSVLDAPAKKMIRRGLFHQTEAISQEGVVMLEIETPIDKDDLVRLKDSYGRTDTGYEGSEHELPKHDECVWIENPVSTKQYQIGDCTVTIERLTSIENFLTKTDNDIIMFLQGGLVKTISGRQHLVTKPGDVGEVKVVRQVASEMDGFAEDTIILTIK
jgi:mannose-6-phosphate isomerase-like protein (cupin superfamily)